LLPEGSCLLSGSIRRRGGTLTFTDTLRIEQDRTEELVDGQNALVLSQYGPTVAGSAAALEELLQPGSAATAAVAVPVTLRIEPGWLLLALLLALLALEWGLRRYWRLDR
jgi:hypothetical protein